MLALVAAALLAASPGPGDAARAELDAVAGRIERLKERRLAGADVDEELTRLLVRAQELAADIERRTPRAAKPAPEGPPPEELRERADALRDEADRLAAELEAVEVELADAARERRREAALEALSGDSALFGESDLGGRDTARTSAAAGSTGSTGGEAAVAERTRRTPPPDRPAGAALGGEGTVERVRGLEAQRADLAERIAALRADAERLDAAARRAAEE